VQPATIHQQASCRPVAFVWRASFTNNDFLRTKAATFPAWLMQRRGQEAAKKRRYLVAVMSYAVTLRTKSASFFTSRPVASYSAKTLEDCL